MYRFAFQRQPVSGISTQLYVLINLNTFEGEKANLFVACVGVECQISTEVWEPYYCRRCQIDLVCVKGLKHFPDKRFKCSKLASLHAQIPQLRTFAKLGTN